MTVINDDQREKLVGRIAKCGLLFAIHSMDTDSKEDSETCKAITKKAKKLIIEIKKYHMPEMNYQLINTMLDYIKKDRNSNGEYTIHYDLLDNIESILRF